MSSNPVVDIFGKLSNVKQLEVIQKAEGVGAYQAAEEYSKEIGISVNGLYRRLRKELVRKSGTQPYVQRGVAGDGKPEAKLTREEKRFLKDLKSGKASLEEASRLVAHKVFEKMFLNPGNVKFLDFFRTELLKIKKMEAETKRTWAMQLVSRMFGGGELPPPVCPNCKYVLVKGGDKMLEGDLIGHDQSVSDTGTA